MFNKCSVSLIGILPSREPGSIPGSGRSPGEGNGTHSSILSWKTPWTEKPGGLRPLAHRVGYDWTTYPLTELNNMQLFLKWDSYIWGFLKVHSTTKWKTYLYRLNSFVKIFICYVLSVFLSIYLSFIHLDISAGLCLKHFIFYWQCR